MTDEEVRAEARRILSDPLLVQLLLGEAEELVQLLRGAWRETPRGRSGRKAANGRRGKPVPSSAPLISTERPALTRIRGIERAAQCSIAQPG